MAQASEPAPAPQVIRPTLAAVAPEWREDWLSPAADGDAPFYNHLIASLCSSEAAGKQAHAVEAIQRFRSREAAEQFRGEQGEALTSAAIDHPLVWSSAQAIAKVGEAAKSQLYVRMPEAVKAQEVPARSAKARVPSRSRTCSAVPSAEASQAVLAKLGLSATTTKSFSAASGEASAPLQGKLPQLASDLTWTAVMAGDGEQQPLALSTSGDGAQLLAAWEQVSNAAQPLALLADVKATSINEANSLRDRRWLLADGRWLRLTLNDSQALLGGRNTTLMITLARPR